jgi:hypothetical protein
MIPVALITSPTTQRRRATHGAGMLRLPAQSPRGAARCETCLSGSAVLSSYSSITRNPYPRSADEFRRYLPFVITLEEPSGAACMGLRLQIPPSRLRPHFVKAKVRVHQYYDGTHAIFHGPQCLARYDADGRVIEETVKWAA